MKRRIIRSFSIGLLLLCLAAWWASGFYSVSVGYRREGRFGVGGFTAAGCVRLGADYRVFSLALPAPPDGFNGRIYRDSHPGFMALRYNEPEGYYFGFGCFAGHTKTTGWGCVIIVPYWFLTLILVVLLWLVWRKTRPKPMAGAFPVELSKPSEKP